MVLYTTPRVLSFLPHLLPRRTETRLWWQSEEGHVDQHVNNEHGQHGHTDGQWQVPAIKDLR